MTESKAVECPAGEEDGGCYPRPKGFTITIKQSGSENSLTIGESTVYVTYAFDSIKNYSEENFTFWDESYKKGSVKCQLSPFDCINSEYANIAVTVYHDGLISKASDKCSTCYYPEGNLENTCENDKFDMVGRFYGGYTVEEDSTFDLIIGSMTKPVCGE
ncbi:MAG: hypothetical protein ABIE03_06385 [Patescibacteria group bacterium]|nr:hypothetical protein [Patescibacteria group bacterium]